MPILITATAAYYLYKAEIYQIRKKMLISKFISFKKERLNESDLFFLFKFNFAFILKSGKFLNQLSLCRICLKKFLIKTKFNSIKFMLRWCDRRDFFYGHVSFIKETRKQHTQITNELESLIHAKKNLICILS